MNEISFERWVNLSSSRKDILSLCYNNIKIRTHDGSNYERYNGCHRNVRP